MYSTGSVDLRVYCQFLLYLGNSQADPVEQHPLLQLAQRDMSIAQPENPYEQNILFSAVAHRVLAAQSS